MTKGFLAFPSEPQEVSNTLRATERMLREDMRFEGLHSWEQNDIVGRCLVDPIRDELRQADCIVADITRLNFNVVYEIGFAIGLRKAVILTRNDAIRANDQAVREVGIFDTIGCQSYSNSAQLAQKLCQLSGGIPLKFDERRVNKLAPVYLLMPRQKTDFEIHILARVKKARLKFRSFDPQEQGRLSAFDAIENVAQSHGVIVPLLQDSRLDALVHNIRAAFICGLADAMGKRLLLMQWGDDPVPLDLRDLACRCRNEESIKGYVGDFAAEITAALQSDDVPRTSARTTALAQLVIGSSAAENEIRELGRYYLQTDEYQRTLRGEARIVVGRKGSGKTALFMQVRDKLRERRDLVILDLKPEGFQLVKFKERVLSLLEEGTQEHTITAFWEYLLILEVCQKIIENDSYAHVRDHTLFEDYQTIAKYFKDDVILGEGDFAERMLRLTQRIADNFQTALGTIEGRRHLPASEITRLIYTHNMPEVRKLVLNYLRHKGGLWILFDNLDKGWPAHGVTAEDITILRCLLTALTKLEQAVQNTETECHCIVFVRNDVYELLMDRMPDRGKVSRVLIDWTDPELLREMLRRRFATGGMNPETPFAEFWPQICTSHYEGEETSQYMVERCLMRPRSLIELFQYCRSHAVNLQHTKIDGDDLKSGEESYSADMVANIGFEMRDVFPEAESLLYEFIGSRATIGQQDLKSVLARCKTPEEKHERITDLLLWYGFLGVRRLDGDGDVAYIYSVRYDIKRLKALIHANAQEPVYLINPAFWAGLEIQS